MGPSALNLRADARNIKRSNLHLRKAVLVGNYTPRVCGIATFTRDLLRGLKAADTRVQWDVVAMNDRDAGFYAFGPDVKQVIQQDNEADYLRVADAINQSGADAVFVQHEFGIFGGAAGSHLLLLLERLRAPVIVTLHTVLASPNDDQRRVLNAILQRSQAVIVMAKKGAQLLQDVYGAPEAKIRVIPHGAPSRPVLPTASFKSRFGLAGHQTITTFGLLSPNKGIETIIKAMPRILQTAPEALYVVAGATHPNLVRERGETYRDSLVELAAQLGVAGAVRFLDKYLGDDELVDLLQATDVYVTPYLTETQITSGTLSYAIALGKPIVSTPYWHAVEALADGVGTICPFGDSEAFGREIADLLSDETRRTTHASLAWQSGLESRWPVVGAGYLRAARAGTRIINHAVNAPTERVTPASAHG